MKIEYDSTNSGGSWWLSDDNWKLLEKGGWIVEWHKDKKDSVIKGDRFLGALATNASKEFDTAIEALEEFEKLTGADISDEGCNCCGPPHSFQWTDDKGKHHYASGDELLQYLHPDKDVNKSKRQLLEG